MSFGRSVVFMHQFSVRVSAVAALSYGIVGVHVRCLLVKARARERERD